jgi:hypothetical protein
VFSCASHWSRCRYITNKGYNGFKVLLFVAPDGTIIDYYGPSTAEGEDKQLGDVSRRHRCASAGALIIPDNATLFAFHMQAIAKVKLFEYLKASNVVVSDRGFFASSVMLDAFKSKGVTVVQPHFKEETAFDAVLVHESRAIASFRASNEQSNSRLKEQRLLQQLPLDDVDLLQYYLSIAVYLANNVYKPLYDANTGAIDDALHSVPQRTITVPDAVSLAPPPPPSSTASTPSSAPATGTAPSLVPLLAFPNAAELSLPMTDGVFRPLPVRPTGEPAVKRAKVRHVHVGVFFWWYFFVSLFIFSLFRRLLMARPRRRRRRRRPPQKLPRMLVWRRRHWPPTTPTLRRATARSKAAMAWSVAPSATATLLHRPRRGRWRVVGRRATRTHSSARRL